MAFTGVAVVTKVTDGLVRITGLSLAASAAGTIGLEGSGAGVELPAACDWGDYGDIDLAEAVQVTTNPQVPLTIAKTASPFLITITNDQAVALGAQAILGKMTATDPQNVADAGTAPVGFAVETYDVGGCADVATDAFTAPVTGKYLITANVEWGGSVVADALFQLTMLINGGAETTMRNSINVQNAGADARSTGFATVVDLTAGQVVTFQVFIDAGAAQDMLSREATFSLLAGAAPAATSNLEIYVRFH